MTATAVAPVAKLAPASACQHKECPEPAAWQVGPSQRTCKLHVGHALEELYLADPRPFLPPVPTPLAGGWKS